MAHLQIGNAGHDGWNGANKPRIGVEDIGLLLAAIFVAVGALAGPDAFSTPIAHVVFLSLCALAAMHGATDYLIARQQLPKLGTQARYLSIYVALAAITAALLLFVPMLVLPALLVLSASHFGAHISVPNGSRAQQAWYRFSFGASPILAAMLLDRTSSEALFAMFVGERAPQLTQGAIIVLPVVLLGLGLWSGASIRTLQVGAQSPAWSNAVAHLVVAVCLFAVLPLLPAFCIYFALLHAPAHGGAFLSADAKQRQRILTEAAALTCLAGLVLIPLFVMAMPPSSSQLGGVVLATLLAVAVPHAVNDKLVLLLRV